MEKFSVLKNADFVSFLGKLSQKYEVFYPTKSGSQRFFQKFPSPAHKAVIGEVRPFEPLKAFFSPAREKVADGFEPRPGAKDRKPLAVVGVKACDLKGLQIQDYVFQSNGFKDPFYIQNRQQNLIISADCTCAIDTCFCLALGAKPHPQGDFDLNLSPLTDGFLVEVGSNKGQILINENSSFFRKAIEKEILARDEQRSRVIKEVQQNLEKGDIPTQDRFKNIIEENFASPIWEEEARTCVECGACTSICPTCHCFLLYDQKNQDQMNRLRVWDSCMIKDYARVAGGGNPRKRLWMRLRNRFEKKFDFFPKVVNIYACTGCGRCITACPAKIDIRRVLKRLVQHA